MIEREKQLSKEIVSEIFPNESYVRSLELIERIKRLVPFNKDKVIYLETLISYVDALINGDDIHQYTMSQTSKYAKEALSQIMSEVHEQILESYRLERMNLQDDVSKLKDEKSILDSQVSSLQDSKDNLVRETGSLSIEVSKLKRELEELKSTGIRKAEEEVSGERKRLSDEISSLNDEKNTLTTSIGELKDMVDSYNKTISKLGEKDEEIVWESLTEDSPVYSLNGNNIDLFIESLIHEYMEKTDEDYDKARNIIRIKCQGLYTISNVINKNRVNEIKDTMTINAIINKDVACLSPLGIDKMNSIKYALTSIKLPVYKEKKRNIDSIGLNKDTIPTNINSMLRELHLQRVATEAIAKQKILESELECMVGILKSVAGPDYDFSSLLPDELGKLLSLDKGETPTLSL